MASRFFRQAGDSDSDSESSDEESLTSGDEASKPAAPAKPKSRFLRSGGSSGSDASSSSSSSEEESDDSDEEQKPAAGGQKISRFLNTGSDDEDSDEEVKRVVKSAKDKRLEEMEATGNSMNNALKINDWTAISTGESIPWFSSGAVDEQVSEFDKLLRMIQRQQNVGEPIPPFFIRTITDLETSVNDAQSKDAKKKMNATNARAFTAMKQKVKKTLKDFEKEVKQYQAVRARQRDNFFVLPRGAC